MYRIILAGSHNEGAAYAASKGWKRGTFRYATRAATIRGLRVAEIHELPSYAKRYDRHSINAALRFVRAERVVVSPEEWDYTQRNVAQDPQLTIFDELALVADKAERTGEQILETVVSQVPEELVVEHAEQRLAEEGHEAEGSTGEAEQVEDPAPAPKKKPAAPRKKAAPKPKVTGEPRAQMDFL